MFKAIKTHLRPHLDDVAGLWLLKKYLPEAKDSAIEFVPAQPIPKSEEGVLLVGIGLGEFDEHKGNLDDCATTLVFKYLVKRNLIPVADLSAIKRLTNWIFDEDTGKLLVLPLREYSIPTILISEFDRSGSDSLAVARLGFQILDALLVNEKNMVELELDWSERIAFMSKFGSAVALKTRSRNSEAYAYARDFDLAIVEDKDKHYFSIKGKASTTIDLSSVYEKLQQLDPQADWYFHHSKKMLICGSELVPTQRLSKLKLEELVELCK